MVVQWYLCARICKHVWNILECSKCVYCSDSHPSHHDFSDEVAQTPRMKLDQRRILGSFVCALRCTMELTSEVKTWLCDVLRLLQACRSTCQCDILRNSQDAYWFPGSNKNCFKCLFSSPESPHKSKALKSNKHILPTDLEIQKHTRTYQSELI